MADFLPLSDALHRSNRVWQNFVPQSRTEFNFHRSVLFSTSLSTSHTLLDKRGGRTPITRITWTPKVARNPGFSRVPWPAQASVAPGENGAAEAGIKHHGGCG